MIKFYGKIEKGLFFLLCLLIVLIPIPYGSNRPWAIGFAEIEIFFILTFVIISRVMPNYLITKTPHSFKIIIQLFLLSIAYQFLLIVPLPSNIVQLLSDVRFENHFSAFPHLHSQYLSLSYDRFTSFITIVENIAYIALFYISYHLINTPRRLSIMLWLVVASGLVQALYGIVEMFSIQHSIKAADFKSASHTISGTFINRNHFSSFIVFSIGATIGLLLLDTKMNRNIGLVTKGTSVLLDYRWHLRIVLIIFVSALLYSQSRGAEVGLTVAILIGYFLFLIKRKHIFRKSVKIALFSLPIFVFIIYMSKEGWLNRFSYLIENAPQRVSIWENSLKLFYDYWLTGVGPGNFQFVYPIYQKFGSEIFVDHAHNDYIELLVEQGVIGLTLLSLPILFSLYFITKRIIRNRRLAESGIQIAALITLLAVLMHSFVDFIFQIPALVVYFYLFLALALRNFKLG